MEKRITTIEFLPDRIRLLVGYCHQKKIHVLYSAEGEELPFDENFLPDKDKAIASLNNLVNKAKRSLVTPTLGAIIVLLPPDDYIVKEEINRNEGVDGGITIQDFNYSRSAVNKRFKGKDKIHTLVYDDPILFGTDRGNNYELPLGMSADTFSVTFHVHFISTLAYTHFKEIYQAVLDHPSHMTLVSTFAAGGYFKNPHLPHNYFSIQIEKNYTYVSYVDNDHLVSSKIIPFGYDIALVEAENRFHLKTERALELMRLFGLREDAGFEFVTDEGISLKELSQAFKDGLKPLLEELKMETLKASDRDSDSIIFYGQGSKMEGLDHLIGELCDHSVLIINGKVIGCENIQFASHLGAILISDYVYQKDLNSSLEENRDISNRRSAAISRG